MASPTMSKEFLLVDLFNNLDELKEDPKLLKKYLKKKISLFNFDKLKELIQNYGKLQTKQLFKNLI